MTDEQVRCALRDAVRARILTGWYRHVPLAGVEWEVTPRVGVTIGYDAEGIRSFCAMLAA